MTFRKRILLLLLLTALIALLGTSIQRLPDFDKVETPLLNASPEAKETADHDQTPVSPPSVYREQTGSSQLPALFNQAVTLLNGKEYAMAVTAFDKVLRIAPKMPEAHVNMGFTLVGLEQYLAAKDFFLTAIELNPEQANAYYGLSLAYEAAEDYKSAIGAMRTFIHRTDNRDPYVRKARSALWEWERIMTD
tara:strand:+ start:993 stop:1568 length:576 start_codon:yes stop_codon:yes gene_type:complete